MDVVARITQDLRRFGKAVWHNDKIIEPDCVGAGLFPVCRIDQVVAVKAARAQAVWWSGLWWHPRANNQF